MRKIRLTGKEKLQIYELVSVVKSSQVAFINSTELFMRGRIKRCGES